MARGKNSKRNDEAIKIFAVYECMNDDCKAHWKSYHGWNVISSNFHEDCGTCLTPGKITDTKAGMTAVNTYICATCKHKWERIHPSLNISCCPGCQNQVCMSGVQERHAISVSFTCRNANCRVTWTSPYFDKEFTQRCNKCHNKGRFFSFKSEVVDPEASDGKKGPMRGGRGFGGRGGPHDEDGCDMCQELRKFGTNCLGKVRVQLEETRTENGQTHSKVNFAVNGEGPRPPRKSRPPKGPPPSGRPPGPPPSGETSRPQPHKDRLPSELHQKRSGGPAVPIPTAGSAKSLVSAPRPVTSGNTAELQQNCQKNSRETSKAAEAKRARNRRYRERRRNREAAALIPSIQALNIG